MNHIYKSKWNAHLGAWVACSELVRGHIKNRAVGVGVALACTLPLTMLPTASQAATCVANSDGTFQVNNAKNQGGCEVDTVAPQIGNTSVWNVGFLTYSQGTSRTMYLKNDVTTTLKGSGGISVYGSQASNPSLFDASGKTINLTITNTDANNGLPQGDHIKKTGVNVSHGGTAKIGTLNLIMHNLPNGNDGSLRGGRFEHYGVVTGSSVDADENNTFNGLQSSALFDNLSIDMSSTSQGESLPKYPLLVGIRAIQGAGGKANAGQGSAGYVKVANDLKINLDATDNDVIGIYISGAGSSGMYSQVDLNNSDITIKSTSDRANAIRIGKQASVGTGVGLLSSTGVMKIDTTAAPNSAAIAMTWQGGVLDASAQTASTTITAGGTAIDISGNSSQATDKTITSFHNLVASTTSTNKNLVQVASGQHDYELNITGAGSNLTAASDAYLIDIDVAGTASNPSKATLNLSEGKMYGLSNTSSDSTLNINLDQGGSWNLVTIDSAPSATATFTQLTMSNNAMVNAFNGAGTAAFTLKGNVSASSGGGISLSDGHIGDLLTIEGNYSGNQGRLLVDSRWDNPDNQSTDRLLIHGSADGKTTVSVPNGIIGDVTLGDAPKNGHWESPVVTIFGTDEHPGQTFTGTAETTNAGQAQLVQRNDANGGSNYYWTLEARQPEPPTPNPEPKPTPIYTPGTSGYVQMSRINREMGFDQLGKLHERMGERQTWAWDDCGTRCAQYRDRQAAGNKPYPIWGRINYSDLKEQGQDRFGYASKIGFIQFGSDLDVKTDEARNHRHIGVMATYSHGEHDFYDKYRAKNGLVTDNKHTGTGTTDMYSLGAYSTWYRANGAYLDLVGNVSGIHNSYKSASGNASQNGFGIGVSAEVGRPWQLGTSNWQIEPQAQLSYQYVHLNGFDDDVRHIDGQSDGTLRSRLGVRLAYNRGDHQQRTDTFYVTANVLHDFAGNSSKANIGRDNLKETYKRTWGEVGLGAQLPLSKATYLFGNVRYARSFGGSNDVFRSGNAARESVSGRIGLRYTW